MSFEDQRVLDAQQPADNNVTLSDIIHIVTDKKFSDQIFHGNSYTLVAALSFLWNFQSLSNRIWFWALFKGSSITIKV